MNRDPLSLQEHLPQQQRAVQLPQRHGVDGSLEQVARRIGEERRQVAQQHPVRDQLLPRVRAARQEPERSTHRRRRVVERPAHGQLVVVHAIGIDRGTRLARQPPEHDHRPTRADEPDGVLPRLLGAGSFDHHVRVLPVPRLGAERRDQLPPLLPAADDHRPAARIGHAGREHQPDRARAEDRNPVAGLHTRALDAAQAARERLDHRCDLGRKRRRHRVQVDGGDPLGNEEPVRVCAREELERAALLAARTTIAGAARRGVRRDDAATVDETAELVPERRRRLARQQRMPAPVRLQIGSVGERHLDLHEHVARAGLRPRHLLDPEIAGRVETGRLHGVKTTLSASPRR